MVPNYGQPGQGILLREGMTLAIEPMVSGGNALHARTEEPVDSYFKGPLADCAPGHTVAIRANGPEILTQL
jgi:methionyl aminopeptidase